ncbi:response regulator [Paenibacillus aceris]|uniref:Two-component system response regulator YesN n=1 Tax=Paenibacillus aceris TaxID=869555 RepID=A0ABS4HXJ8_9BACL|nr:response regulator [Paenibacillus aceris]MBP1963382.1 two-component system response regulator YesN [Paenibacillus aceris]NHW36112.1 response regulator [Paenibacillus aceris]
MKVVIVDDDSIIRKGLSRTVPWEQNGFTLVGLARDGEEALSLIAEVRPNLLITDIRMPFMDGFQLTEAVKENYPDIKIIMLTSFDEFELAHRALKLKVFDYLLKPVDSQLLLDTAKRSMAELAYENEMKRKVVEGMPLLRQRFLEKLIKNNLSEEEIRSQSEFFNFTMPRSKYVVILLTADDYSYPDYQNRFGKEMLKFCILNVAEETVLSDNEGIVFESEKDEIVIIYNADGEQDLIVQKTLQIAETIRVNVEKYLKTTVTVGIGFIYDKPSDVSRSYRDAKAAIEFRHMIGTNRVLTVGDTGLPPTSSTEIILNELENEFVMKVKLGLEKEAHAVLNDIEQRLLEIKFVSLAQVRLIGIEISLLLFKELEEIAKRNVKFKEGLESVYTYYNELERFQTVQDIFASIRHLTARFLDIANRQREIQTQSMVHKAIDYIESHYATEGLSLQEVARYVHISPTYLSILFKKEKSITFSDFLLQTRMKAAIEMLRMSGLKSYEVAEKVGYSNPQYFSQCFKKYTGFSPTDYKNNEH